MSRLVFFLCFLSNMPRKFCILFILLPTMASGQCLCSSDAEDHDESEALRYKLASFASVLAAGAVGVSLPLLGKKLPALRPENDIFFTIKAFAAGVILATGFIHILPDAFSNLSSPCLSEQPWGKFPFAGFVAMLFSIGTLMVDTLAAGFYKKQHFVKSKQVIRDEEIAQELAGHVHVHTHATHGHAHGSASDDGEIALPELIRRRIISQVLEVGIVVHSVIIGVSLGASQSPATMKALLVALSFHQFFEGMGLGSCISQAEFKSRSTAIMATFFSLTTPVGIAIGIGISSFYEENNPRAMIVEGILESASAGILIYMALVDLLAADLMNPRMQANLRLQLGAHVSLLLGAGCMSVLAKWA